MKSPARARRVALDPRQPTAQAVRRGVAEALRQLQANAEGILATGDPEFVHQLRVALRRLRTALRAYRAVLEPGFEAAISPGLRSINRVAGAVRDLDVLAGALLPAMVRDGAPTGAAFDRMVVRLARRRDAARARLRAALRSARHRRLELALARWLAASHRGGPERGMPLPRLAAKAVRRHRRRLGERARDFASLDAAGRHAVRIAAKRLRYVVEGFASLFPARQVEAYLEALSALQDDLGRANDATVARGVVAALRPPKAFARFAGDWLAACKRGALQSVPDHLAKLEAAPRFWDA